MVAATRRQRARAASNTGEQALLVLRKNGWMTSPDDARSEAVCRAAALADDKLPASTAVRRLTERFARNVCAFLVPLIAAGPAYADAVRLELKEFTNHPSLLREIGQKCLKRRRMRCRRLRVYSTDPRRPQGDLFGRD